MMLGVLALLSAGSFLAYTIYGAVTKNRTSAEQKEAIIPLVGKLNDKAIADIVNRRQFSVTELENVQSIDYSFKETVEGAEDSGIVEGASIDAQETNFDPNLETESGGDPDTNTTGEGE